VDESHRCDAKLVLGQIDTMEFQVRMCNESVPDLVEVSRIDIEADDSLDGRGVGVFETVATSDAQNGDAVWDADVQGAFEKARQGAQLLHIVGAHVAFVVCQWDREPRI
jgi:hypothetical protein